MSLFVRHRDKLNAQAREIAALKQTLVTAGLPVEEELSC